MNCTRIYWDYNWMICTHWKCLGNLWFHVSYCSVSNKSYFRYLCLSLSLYRSLSLSGYLYKLCMKWRWSFFSTIIIAGLIHSTSLTLYFISQNVIVCAVQGEKLIELYYCGKFTYKITNNQGYSYVKFILVNKVKVLFKRHFTRNWTYKNLL